MTFTEAAIEVLRREGKPLHFKKIAEIAVRESLLDHVGKVPDDTMADQLTAHCRLPHEDRRIIPIQSGTFALVEWGMDEDPAGLEDLIEPPPAAELPYRGRERHPIPSRDVVRGAGRSEGRRRREEEGGRPRRFPPPAEVAYEILAGADRTLTLVEIAAQGAERLLMPDAFVRDLNALRAALQEDNRRRDTAGRRPLFQLEGDTVTLAAQPEPGEKPAVPAARAPVTAADARRAGLAALRRRLRECDPPTVEHVVCRMLERLGFRELKVAKRGREHVIYTARRRLGLADVRHGIRILRGSAEVGRRDVPMLRRDLGHYGAQIGAVVSAGEAIREARGEAGAPGQLPVLLLCGEALAEAFTEAGVGCAQVVVPEIDEAFFEPRPTRPSRRRLPGASGVRSGRARGASHGGAEAVRTRVRGPRSWPARRPSRPSLAESAAGGRVARGSGARRPRRRSDRGRRRRGRGRRRGPRGDEVPAATEASGRRAGRTRRAIAAGGGVGAGAVAGADEAEGYGRPRERPGRTGGAPDAPASPQAASAPAVSPAASAPAEPASSSPSAPEPPARGRGRRPEGGRAPSSRRGVLRHGARLAILIVLAAGGLLACGRGVVRVVSVGTSAGMHGKRSRASGSTAQRSPPPPRRGSPGPASGWARAAHRYRARLEVIAVRQAAVEEGVAWRRSPSTLELAPPARIDRRERAGPSDVPGRTGARDRMSARPRVPAGGSADAWRKALESAVREASTGLALALSEEAKPVEKLVRDLRSPGRAALREQAIRSWATAAAAEAVPALIERLADPEPLLAERAAGALAQIRDPRAVGPLIDYSRRDDDAAHTARFARIIGDVGGSEARGYLLTLESGHLDPRVRAAAREALQDLEQRERERSGPSDGQGPESRARRFR